MKSDIPIPLAHLRTLYSSGLPAKYLKRKHVSRLGKLLALAPSLKKLKFRHCNTFNKIDQECARNGWKYLCKPKKSNLFASVITNNGSWNCRILRFSFSTASLVISYFEHRSKYRSSLCIDPYKTLLHYRKWTICYIIGIGGFGQFSAFDALLILGYALGLHLKYTSILI